MTEQLLYLPAPGSQPSPPIAYPATKPAPPSPRQTLNLWQKQPHESPTWFRRFRQDYLALGPKRTVLRAAQHAGVKYVKDHLKWRNQAREFRWKERAQAWDEHLLDIELERREEILKTGLALDHERVFVLKDLEDLERGILFALANAVMEDPTSAKSGKLATRYSQFKVAHDSTLKALAEETGGRAKRINVHTELESFAISFAKEQGYDETKARAFAKVVEIEAKNSG